ncbi:HEAT repeat domain-containing protein [Paenibacillus sp. OK076]|uniref:HEAT repeat domain-containing protein n=1 Tax=Paenibacillus sp. OK076 TaxID=1884379 RepID=UPI0008C2CE8E|nr:HEAT repeat domain-containing protein [Paenibacillus sp. OK076]SEO78385.1 HEAT repeat [Paenibacillus sp. OK076]
MRQFSSEFQEKINRLGTGNVQQTVEQLREVGMSRVYAAIPAIIRMMDNRHSAIIQAAEQAVATLLAVCPLTELVWLNEHVREWRPSPLEWKKSVEREMRTMDLASATRLSVLTMHWSGYIREAAVRKMIENDQPYTFPYLLLRLNDWVPEIRDLAKLALERKRKPEYAKLWMENIILVERLRICGRDLFEEWIESIHNLLRQKECRYVIHSARVSPDAYIRRLAFRISIEENGTDNGMIIEQALRDDDPSIRRWAAWQVDGILSGQNLKEALLRMQQDSIPSIRRESLASLATMFPEDAKEIIADRLLDPDLSVRDTARRHGKQWMKGSYAEWYLDMIWSEERGHLAAAIAGLGETGEKADAEVVFDYAQHSVVAVRKAVIRGLTRLNPSSYGPYFINMLQDPQPGISREACRALRRHPHLIPPDEVAELLGDKAAKPHVIRNVLRIISVMDRWTQLGLLLRLLPTAQPEWVKHTLLRQLHNWVEFPNRSYGIRLTIVQLERLHQYLEWCRPELDNDLIRRLEWLIQ